MKGKNAGFTLVELIVCVAIIAVLATVTVLSFSSLASDANKSADAAVAKAITSALASTLSDFNNKTLGTAYTSANPTVSDCLAVNDLTEASLISKRKGYKLYYNKKTKKAEFLTAASTDSVLITGDLSVVALLTS